MKKKNHNHRSIFRLVRAGLQAIFLLCAFGCASAASSKHTPEALPGETVSAESRHLRYGVPGTADQIVRRDGYALGFSDRHKQAVWVSYELNGTDLSGPHVERSNRFLPDPEIAKSAVPGDYTRSGYDRGHLAPAADMARSGKTMKESFYMSNISPQRPHFNRGIWLELEKQVRHFAKTEGRIIIITGPVLPSPGTAKKSIGRGKVTVPKYFYKVIYDPTPPEKMVAFIIPNRGSRRKLQKFVVPVDRVEELTGLDFFNLLPETGQSDLEKTVSTPEWEWIKK